MIDLLALFSNSRDIGFITDRRGAILAATQGAQKALGYGRPELVGLDLPRLSVGDEFRPFFSEEAGAESRMRAGFQLRTKSGRILTVDAVASCLRDEAGAAVGWFFAGQDLRGALAEARGSRTFLDALVDSIGAALWSFDRNGTVITWSRACQHQFGIPRGEAEGKLPAVRLFPSPEDFRRVVRQVDETGRFTGEVPLHPREGAPRACQLSVTRLASAEGLSLGYTAVSFDVTERRRVEEFERVLFERAGEAILVVDVDDGRFLDANDKACEIHGYTRDEILKLRDLRPPGEDPAVMARIRRILDETGRYEGEEERHRRKDGTVFPCALNIRRVSVGGRRYSVMILRDLSERRRAEEYFRVLFEKANSGILMVEADTLRIAAANEKAAELLGAGPGGLAGADLLSLHPEFDQEAARKVMEEVRARGEGVYRQLWLLRRDGTAFPIEASARRIVLSDRAYVVLHFQDITEQARAERELEEAKTFLEHIQENASDGFALLDDRGVYVSVNRKMCEISGRTREDYLGRHYEEQTLPEYREAHRQHFAKLLAGESVQMRTRLVTPGGEERFVDVSSAPVRRGGRRYVFAIVRDVTGQVRSQEALHSAHGELERRVEERTAELRESEERFRSAFDSAAAGMCLIAPDGRFLQVNRFFCRMLGYEEKDLLGKSVQDVTHPDDLPPTLGLIGRALSGEISSFEIEKRSLHREGRVVRAFVAATLLRDPEGRPLYFVAELQDVTERRRVEETLRESEARFRGAFEHGGIGMAVVGPDGRFLEVNHSLCEMLGYPEGELLALTFQAITHPEDQAKSGELARRLLSGEVASAAIQKRYFHKQGRVVWADLATTLIRDGGGKPLYFVSGIQDVSERRAAEETLRESEARFRSTMDMALDAVIGMDARGTITYWNRRAEEMFGWSGEEAAGRSLAETIVPPAQREAHRRGLERFLATGEGAVLNRRIELTALRRNGTEFPVEISVTALRRGDSPTFTAFVEDITERKRAHQELERRVEERTGTLTAEIAERRRTEEDLRLYREIFAHSNDAINLVSPQGTLLAQNEAHRRLLGYEDAEILGTSPATWAREGFGRGMREIERSGTFRGEIINVTKSGEERIVELSAFPVRNASGGVLCYVAVKRDVTERKRSEERLAKLAEEQELLLTHARDFVYRHDAKGVFTYMSPAVERVTGHTVEDWLAHYTKFLTDHPMNARVIEYTEETLRTGRQSPPYLVEVTHRDGRRIVLEVSEQAYDEGGRIAGIVGVARDVTGRYGAERRLAVQHEVTRILAEAASLEEALPRILGTVGQELAWDVGAAWRADSPARVLRCGDVWHRPAVELPRFLEACRRSALKEGTGLPGRVWSARRPLWLADVRECGSPRVPAAVEEGLRSAFGFPVLAGEEVLGVVEFFSREARPADAELLGMMGSVGIQIGQFAGRKSAGETLRFQKALLESQSEAAIDGILVVSGEGVMISFNRRFVEMWGIPAEVAESRSDERALQSVLDKLVDPKGFLDRVTHLYRHPEEESRDEIALKDGRTFDRYSGPVRSLDGAHYGRVWYFRDVTGRKRTEQELRRAAEETRKAYEDLQQAQEQLIRSEKLASIGMLVSGVAHEINNPLNVMYGNLQLLARSSGLRGANGDGNGPSAALRAGRGRAAAGRARKLRQMIRDALKAAKHARRIVEDFRSFARDTRTAEPVDLNVCLEETVSLFQRELGTRIRVVKRLGRLPPIRCFRGQMNQVFLNLLKNASEAIEKKGTITLRTRRSGDRVVLEVADTGRGMPEEVRRKLFEPFFTTKPVGKGLGLGLSISAMIVQNHGGAISATSRPGRGSVFRVELPIRPR